MIHSFSLLFGVFLISACQKKTEQVETNRDVEIPVVIDPHKALESKALELHRFAQEAGYSTEEAILIDFSRHSGQNRYFIWDFQKNKPEYEGLVAHGHCQSPEASETVVFSNVEGSNCSAEGKYGIGQKYEGQFGTAYKLNGLEDSNSAAFKRYIVMHGHDCVPDTQQSSSICQSEGCPTLSPEMMKTAIKVIDGSEKPILMWIFKA